MLTMRNLQSDKIFLWGFVLVLSCISISNAQVPNEDLSGLFPVVFNLATRSRISANATCGEMKSEVYCKLVEHIPLFTAQTRQCDICDARNSDPNRRHPVRNAIDGSQKWWQSPTLTSGTGFNYVTLTLDLGQIYQIAYIIVKSANSPRPGNWILERSLDGVNFMPWQYFAMTDAECLNAYGIQATVGLPTFLRDDQVICTSRYSALNPLENGEIFVSLVNGRPGVFQPSKLLLDFTSARYVRLRFQKIRTLNADLMTFERYDPLDLDPTVTRRYFYSVKDISIGGQCICYGHAAYCRRHDFEADKLQCQCMHNTAGDNCEKCLPKFNQMPWQVGGIQNIGCKECNCHNKANECAYNATVDAQKLSLNMEGKYEGGGVCLDCKEYTTGMNCEHCIDGYYRRSGTTPDMSRPCVRCRCRKTRTSTDKCVPDDSRVSEGMNAGDCICMEGYAGSSCNRCAFGYTGYPDCKKCKCNPAGTVDPKSCSGRACICKENVAGSQCDFCEQGHFNLDQDNPLGCTACFCFGVSKQCDSVQWGVEKVSDFDDWLLSLKDSDDFTLFPRIFDNWLEGKPYLLKADVDPRSSSLEDIHFWVAPMTYLGNRLSSYGGFLSYTLKYILDGNVPIRHYLRYPPNIILQGSNITLKANTDYMREIIENKVSVRLLESSWSHLSDNRPASRDDLMTLLYKLDRILIRATYHTAQNTVYLKDVKLDSASPLVMNGSSMPDVEKCRCPQGYAGLSCETCAPGWTRVNNKLYRGVCRKCQCNNHASECDPYTGKCLNCQHSTTGNNCDMCLPGFYGDPRLGTPDVCKPCACPLVSGSNFFADRCLARPTAEDRNAYECLNCLEGYMGSRCEMCAPGFYGNPNQPGGSCRRCSCGGNIDMSRAGNCNNVTGVCNMCANNTEGEYCERCVRGYYGSAVNGDCRPCACYEKGSNNLECNPRNGQCSCRTLFAGRRCDRCQAGYGNIALGCERCNCDRSGSVSLTCDPITGDCSCRDGVGGPMCGICKEGYYGYPRTGCQACNCYGPGTENSVSCDVSTGSCQCQPNVEGRQCDRCKSQHFGLVSGTGCSPCNCSPIGSYNSMCNEVSGRCNCKPGVGGRQCDRCLDEHYGFSDRGCSRCKPCNKIGHICDPLTGECVCPPNTEGPNCERCTTNCWGYDKDKGCKPCNCTMEGSASQLCDPLTGTCSCTDGFQGFSCDMCVEGYFNFPNCQPCSCNKTGVVDSACQSGMCQCDDRNGQCPCKTNVIGKYCDQCRPNTFSLDRYNPKGCTECYCFFRSRTCTQAPYVWSTVQFRSLEVEFVEEEKDSVRLKREFGYLYIDDPIVYIPIDIRERPVFWRILPLTSDMILSYGGNMSFLHFFEGSVNNPLIESPIVILVGNGFRIEYGPTTLEPMTPLEVIVPLHENYWSLPGVDGPITRRLMMVVLQNVSAIFVRAAQNGIVLNAGLEDIRLQKAVPQGHNVTSTEIAKGVELCQCPERYSGESCQNPGKGFYRRKPDDGDINFSTPETVIGSVSRCRCFGNSALCDPDTGLCQDCQHNTIGDSCERCADGFYGIATRGAPDGCKPCACPLPYPSNNFSPRCVEGRNGFVCTDCQDGYIGDKCERCAPGYYGNPLVFNETCMPCDCNPDGSVSNVCEQLTGQCACIPGVMGFKCDECSDIDSTVQNGSCVSCYTGCTGILLDELANLTLPSSLRINVSAAAYPWDRLKDFEKQVKDLRKKLNVSQDAGIAGLKNYKAKADKYDGIADNRRKESVDIKDQAEKLQDEADKILDNATALENEVNQLAMDIKDIVDSVKKLQFNESVKNMTERMKEAQEILDAIQSRDFKDEKDATREENRQAELLSETIKNISAQIVNTTNVREMVDDLHRRLQDIFNESHMADEKAKIALERIKDLKDLLARVKSIKDDIAKNNEDTRNLLIEEARKIIQKAEDDYEGNEGKHNLIDQALEDLRKKVEKLEKAYPKLIDLTRKAFEHAFNLTQQAEELDKLLADARNVSGKAVQAAKAYQSIVDAIKEAEESANNAKKAANASVTLAGVSDLKEEVNKLISKSEGQKAEAQNLLKKTGDVKREATNLESDLIAATEENNKLKELLEKLKRELSQAVPSDLGKTMKNVNESSKEAKRKAEKALDIMKRLNSTFDSKLKYLKDFAFNDFNYDIESDLKQAGIEADNVKKLIRDEQNVKSKVQTAYRKLSDIALDLDRLKEKIRDARTIVNNMKMSLKADGDCHRSYRSPLRSSAANEIRFSFQMNNTESDMLLLLLQRSPQEYIAMEIRSKKVRFSWNSGKGEGQVSHHEEIKPNVWYTVLAKRIGAVGQLKVWDITDSNEKSTQAVVASKGAGCSLMNLNENSTVLLAGSGNDQQIPSSVTNGNFVGCMGNVFIDSNPVGTHNFKTNEDKHCGACVEVPTKGGSGNIHKFSGYGFALYQYEKYNNKRTKVELSFKTFYEDSLLFFTGNTDTGDFVSIALKNGKVIASMNLGGISNITVTSNKTYNNNKWTQVILERRSFRGQLTIKQGEDEEIPYKIPGANSGLEAKGYPLFFGGLPKQFDMSKFKDFIKEPYPYFYGCMENFGFSGSTNILTDSSRKLVNVELDSQCNANGIPSVSFKEKGYLTLDKSDEIQFSEPKNDISLAFITEKEDGILLIARDIPGENYYSISLVGGIVEARLKSNITSPITLKSSSTFNDGALHCVSLIKNDQTSKVMMLIDDVEMDSKDNINIGFDAGFLYLGGSPVKTEDITPTKESYEGCISDLIANGVLLSMSDAKQYKRADIGRCPFTDIYPEPILTDVPDDNGDVLANDSPYSGKQEQCCITGKPQIYDTALSVGDEGNFFAKFSEVFSRNNYVSISFDFRTYYPNGLFSYLHNPKTGFYFGIQLVNGKIQVKYTHNNRSVEINFLKVLNNGRWHSVNVEKKDRIVSASHDSEKVQTRNIRRLMSGRMNFFLGAPSEERIFTESSVKLVPYSIRGCLRGLELDGKEYNISEADVIHDSRKCYQKAEKGAFFRGNAWAMIDNDFVITSNFSLSMEFRTTQPEAILASVSSQRGDNGFTIELHNGQLEFTLVLKSIIHRLVSSSVKFRSLSDREWHKVEIHMGLHTMSLSVDRKEPDTMDIYRGIRKTKTHSALFIGGYKYGYHQGASISMEPFRGCLNNVNMNGRELDWYSSYQESSNIRKTACPVS